MNSYKATLVIKPGLKEEEAKKFVEEISGEIKKEGGKVTESELSPSKQRLAYGLGRYIDGLYLRLSFLCQPAAIESFEKRLKNNRNVLRHLIIRGK